jgi:hypothetical protein
MAQRACPPLGDALGGRLGGCAAGQRVYVLGNGPSTTKFDIANIPAGSQVIACNGALALCQQADVWLTSESTVYRFDWFYGHGDFAGAVVWEQHCANGAAYLSAYPDDFLRRVLWHNRRELNAGFDIRRQGDGLVYVRGAVEGECYGTVALQAIHLAGIMGAAEVHLYGVELYFPAGQQHADGWQPYTVDGPEQVRIVRFNLVDSVPVPDPEGQFGSTPFFIDSAAAIQTVLAHPGAAGLKVVDHSDGLLSHLRMPPPAAAASAAMPEPAAQAAAEVGDG